MISKATNFDVLDIPAIHTLYEIILPGACTRATNQHEADLNKADLQAAVLLGDDPWLGK